MTSRSVSIFVVGFLVFALGVWSLVSTQPAEAQSGAESSKQAASTPMNNERLGKLLKEHFPKSPVTQKGPNVWIIKPEAEEDEPEVQKPDEPLTEETPLEKMDGMLLVMTDEKANRMRIMMPIQAFDPEKAEDLTTALYAMHANYDRALDARYAINDGILWSAFIHPLRSLTAEDLTSALHQVQTLRKNTGTTYSSGALIFGPGIEEKPKDENTKKLDRTA